MKRSVMILPVLAILFGLIAVQSRTEEKSFPLQELLKKYLDGYQEYLRAKVNNDPAANRKLEIYKQAYHEYFLALKSPNFPAASEGATIPETSQFDPSGKSAPETPEQIRPLAGITPKHKRHPWLFGGIHPLVGITPEQIRHPWLFGGIHPLVGIIPATATLSDTVSTASVTFDSLAPR